MRRLPRYLAYLVRRYVAHGFKKSLDPSTYAELLDRTLERVPMRWEDWTREGESRTPAMNRQLAWSMAFVAGAVNAGGFMAVQHYTSHMTGVLSAMADMTALGEYKAVLYAFGMLLFFIGGAFVSTFLISYGQRHRWRARYALALGLEAVLLLMFGYAGARLEAREYLYTDAAVGILSFIMGLHNAVTTNISGAAVRTTHMTGTVTDIGIELSRLLYRNTPGTTQRTKALPILANRAKLRLLLLLAASFFVGGVVGAVGFHRLGYKITVPLAFFLLLLALRPLALQTRLFLRHLRKDLERMD